MKRRRESKKINSLTSLTRQTKANFTFCEGRKQAKIFFLFMNLDMVDRNSAQEEFACIWQSK